MRPPRPPVAPFEPSPARRALPYPRQPSPGVDPGSVPQPAAPVTPTPPAGTTTTVNPLPALTVAALLTLTACGSEASPYSERMAYLRKVADRGVETHNLLTSQGAKIDAKRCSDAYDGLADRSGDIPSDTYNGGWSKPWLDQVRQFFVDSCVTGLPKPVPGQSSPPATSSPPPSKATTPSETP